MALTLTGTLTLPNGASVEHSDIDQPAQIKAYANGVEAGTVNLAGQYVTNEDGNLCFAGLLQIFNFPSQDGNTLTFKYGEQDLIGKTAFGDAGVELQFSIPNQTTPFNLNGGTPFQIYFDVIETWGCMDINATNYNPNATHNDDSCVYEDLSDIFISEIHYTVDDNAQPTLGESTSEYAWEFFEIYNHSDTTLSLAGLGISFFTSAEYKRNGTLWPDGMPSDATIGPYGRVVFANRSDTYNGTCWCIDSDTYLWTENLNCDSTCPNEGDEYRSFEHLIAFNGTNGSTANLYEWQQGSYYLSNVSSNPYNIIIRDANPIAGPNNTTGNLVRKVRYHGGGNNVSDDGENSCLDQWPSNVLSYDRSIVLTHPSLDNNCGSSWFRSGIRGGSPGKPNALSWETASFIEQIGCCFNMTEFYIDPPEGLEASHEFIEIYNGTDVTINTEGFIDLQGDGTRPINISNDGLPSIDVDPGDYLLLTRDGGTDTYTCNHKYTYTGGIYNSGEYITLRDIHGTVVDSVNLNAFTDPGNEVWLASQSAHDYGDWNGGGSTLEFRMWDEDCWVDSSVNYDNYDCWQLSVNQHGSPCSFSVEPVFGCTDSNACGYDSNANVNDNSCETPWICCPDSTSTGNCDVPYPDDSYISNNTSTCGECPDGYLRWIDGGNPGYDVSGCMDENACNYNYLATVNQGCATGDFECLDGTTGCDCDNSCNGSAEENACGVCWGGTTGIVIGQENGFGGIYGQDCNNDCKPDQCDSVNITGCAQLDSCGDCVGGDTGNVVLDVTLSDGDISHGDYPVSSLSLYNTSNESYTAYINLSQDCNGECGGTTVVDFCSICGGNNTDSGGGSQQDCFNICFGDAVDVGCGCGESGQTTYYQDNDGDGYGGGAGQGFCSDPGDSWVLNNSDSNDYCNNAATTGDYYDGDDYGWDDCDTCHYNSSGVENENFNYFSPTLDTSRDCGDGVVEDAWMNGTHVGLCPGDEGFNNPPGTHVPDDNGDGIGNECYNTVLWKKHNNTWGNDGTVLSHGCNKANKCKGDNTYWGPNMYIEYENNDDPILITGELASGCKDVTALNNCTTCYWDCSKTGTGDSDKSCCTYPLDCNGDEAGSAYYDDCGYCSGGNSGHVANSDKDCYGTCPTNAPNSSDCSESEGWNQTQDSCQSFGATNDSCGVCSGGGSDHIADSDIDCAGVCFGNSVENADDFDNCCDPLTVTQYWFDSDNDGLGAGEPSNICAGLETSNWVTNNLDDNDDYYCPDTCGTDGVGLGTGSSPCNIDCSYPDPSSCGGTYTIDECGVCTDPLDPTPVDCAGTCENAEGYGAQLDNCDNCTGGNTNSELTQCFDLVDEVGYTAAYALFESGNLESIYEICPPNWAMDCSGLCLGNSVEDCAGVCGGSSEIDLCGVCYDPQFDTAPNECTGCTDETACNYDSEATIDDGQCRWEDCNGGCTCEQNNQSHNSCSVVLDLCGECGGDGLCEGCTDPNALNFDPYATQNFQFSCVYGDIVITPRSTSGMGMDYLVFSPVGNENTGQNEVHGEIDYNANFGGWRFQDTSEVVESYRLIVDRKTSISQTAPSGDAGGDTIDVRVSEEIDGTIIQHGTYGSEDCDWLELNPNSNPVTGDGMRTFESFINCGYGRTIDTDGTYFIHLHATGSNGTKVLKETTIEMEGIYKIEQSLKLNSQYQMYIPEQGLNIPYYELNGESGSFSNTRNWYETKNKFDRNPLGCFYYDEDQLQQWVSLGSVYKHLQNNLDIEFDHSYLNGVCEARQTHPDFSGTCVGGINDGEPCGYQEDSDEGNEACASGFVYDGGYFSPDVNATTKKAQYNSKAKAHEYYSEETHPEHYKDLSAPNDYQFLFTPREFDQSMSQADINQGFQVFGDRSRKDLSTDQYDYYIGIVDWGDETTSTEDEYDFIDRPIKLGFDTIVKHQYSRPGIYEISGYMFSVVKNDACRTRCSVDEIEESAPPLWYAVTPFPYVFNVDEEWCSNAGGTHINSLNSYCGILDYKKFTYRISVPSKGEVTPFLPYDEDNVVIGGVSADSIYYRTIERELGYLQTGGKLDLKFRYIQDKLETEHAFIKMNEHALKDSSVLNIYNKPILSGSINNDGILQETGSFDHPVTEAAPNPVTIVSSSYDEGYGELPEGSYFGNADMNQIRYFNRGDLTMDTMLGFVNIIPDLSYKLLEGNGAVLITAPHSPRTLRPTALGYDPDGQYPAWDHAPDYYTGAMAYQVAKMTNSHALIATYMQDDPNYYHYIGRDYFERTGETATPAFAGLEGQLHPFKKKLKEYLIEHPEIKLVIDFHGAGEYRVFAADIGVAYPIKNRDGVCGDADTIDPCEYTTGWTSDWGWYPDNNLGMNMYQMNQWQSCDEDFPGPASPEQKRFWPGTLSSQWDPLSDLEKYAPSMVTDLGKGLVSPTNPSGQSLLPKLIEILEDNDIGAGKAYFDRYTFGRWDCDGDCPECESLATPELVEECLAQCQEHVYRYFRGEYLEQDNHSCPDGQDNPYNLADYLDECDTDLYTGGCREAWELYLDGTHYCEEPGVKKPVVIGRDFTAGRQNTITRFVALDATNSDSYFEGDDDGGGADPAPFIGNVDAFQFEMSRNHRTFELDQPRDLRLFKGISEFIGFINAHYGNEVTLPDFESQEFRDSYERTYDLYNNYLKPQGEILLDESVALTQHPGNPSSKRYWKNIIPEKYDITYRDGFYDFSTQLNREIYPGGEGELGIVPVDTIKYNGSNLSICKEESELYGEAIDGGGYCMIPYSDIAFNKFYNGSTDMRLRGDSVSSDVIVSNNIIYWTLPSIDIGGNTFSDIFDGYNNVMRITWIRNGKKKNSTFYDGSWVIDGDSNMGDQLLRLEKGRFYLFEMYNDVNLQRDDLDDELKLDVTPLIHNKKVDTSDNQQWLQRITNIIHKDDDRGCEHVSDEFTDSDFVGCRDNRGEVVKIEQTIPYYPVLPKFDIFGNFSTEEDLQRSEIQIAEGQKWNNDGTPIGEDPGTCSCNASGIPDVYNCNQGYDPECTYISAGNYSCACLMLYSGGTDSEGDSPGDTGLFGIDALVENNIPFGSPERLWYEYDKDNPAVSNNYANNLNNLYTLTSIDVGFDEIDDNILPNYSGVDVYNYVFGDYKIEFDGQTRIPSKGSFENLPQIRKDKGGAY